MPAAYLTCGKIAPEHEGLELSVGGSAISAAIREATGELTQMQHKSPVVHLRKGCMTLATTAQSCMVRGDHVTFKPLRCVLWLDEVGLA